MDAIIYHNPECGTSRTTLAAIRKPCIEPDVIEMMAHPIVITPKGVRLCRPSELVLDLLPSQPHQAG